MSSHLAWWSWREFLSKSCWRSHLLLERCRSRGKVLPHQSTICSLTPMIRIAGSCSSYTEDAATESWHLGVFELKPTFTKVWYHLLGWADCYSSRYNSHHSAYPHHTFASCFWRAESDPDLPLTLVMIAATSLKIGLPFASLHLEVEDERLALVSPLWIAACHSNRYSLLHP